MSYGDKLFELTLFELTFSGCPGSDQMAATFGLERRKRLNDTFMKLREAHGSAGVASYSALSSRVHNLDGTGEILRKSMEQCELHWHISRLQFHNRTTIEAHERRLINLLALLFKLIGEDAQRHGHTRNIPAPAKQQVVLPWEEI